MNFPEAVDWLYGTQLHGIKLGLENTQRLVRALGVDVERLRCIHVAGTNGKGSVCAMLDSIARAAGIKTGLFTSPHLITFRERMRVDGRMISEEEVAARLTAIRKLVEDWDHSPTFFEITTALALAHFQEQKVELAVLETGMGGRLDATNIVKPRVAVLTPIDLDHQQYLGFTLAAIAAEKAGIIKPGVPLVSAPQPEEVATVIRHLAFERGVPLRIIDEPVDDLKIGLAGSHQRWNAALAVEAIDHAQLKITPGAVVRGLANVVWPGRFQQVTDRLVLDGAHNPGAARRLVQVWREVFGDRRATIVLGILKEKDRQAICAALLPIAARFIAVTAQNPRASTAEELRRIVHDFAPGFPCVAARDVRQAMRVAGGLREPVLVTGSLFLVGEVLALQSDRNPVEVSAQ